MAVSQNGYPANDVTLTDVFTVPGTAVRLRLRKGACGRALVEVAAWVDRHVEDIDTREGAKGFDVPDDWSFAERRIRGGEALSNHASGTAMDLNAVQHPLGVGGTWSPNQKTAINHYLEDEWTDPKTGKVVIRWGENYTSRTDGMHFEINADEAAVTRALSAYLARREAEENPLMALSDDDAAKIGPWLTKQATQALQRDYFTCKVNANRLSALIGRVPVK